MDGANDLALWLATIDMFIHMGRIFDRLVYQRSRVDFRVINRCQTFLFVIVCMVVLVSCQPLPSFECSEASEFYVMMRDRHTAWYTQFSVLGPNRFFDTDYISEGVGVVTIVGGNLRRLSYNDLYSKPSMLVFMLAQGLKADFTEPIGKYGFIYSPDLDPNHVFQIQEHYYNFTLLPGDVYCYEDTNGDWRNN